MNNSVCIIQICQSLQHAKTHFTDYFDWDWSVLFVYTIEAALVHEFHADTYVGLRHKCTIERNDVGGIAVMHYLKFAENLLADGWLRVD